MIERTKPCLFSFILIGVLFPDACIPNPSRAQAERDGTIVFYVSPESSDSRTGKTPDHHPGGRDGPFATLEKAQEAVRKIRSQWKEHPDRERPITVYLREGTYRLLKPLQWSPEDCGSGRAPVMYAAYPGESPVISGAVEVTGWHWKTLYGKKVLSASIPNSIDRPPLREFFVNGRRRLRTRLPEEGVYYFKTFLDVPGEHRWNQGSRGAIYFEGDLDPKWRNPREIEIVTLTRWIESRVPVNEILAASKTVMFGRRSTYRLENTRKGEKRAARYRVENVFESLDKPGEWCVDFSNREIYYIPREEELDGSGEFSSENVVLVPVLDQLVRVSGNESSPARNLVFKGLTFRHTEWRPRERKRLVQAAVGVPGALCFRETAGCRLEDCTIEQVGTYAVQFEGTCRDNSIRYCTLRNLGAGGVLIGHDSSHTQVSDCEIHDGGLIYHSAVGVWIGNSGNNRIEHNSIHDFYYTGVSVGWSWGYGPTKTQNNRIEYNHIYNIGKGLLSDMGGIYTLGLSDGTRLSHNLIHDVSSYSYGGWGIYPDEGSTHLTIDHNVVYRTKTGGFHQHYGRENLVKNNIFTYAVVYQIQRSREEDHQSFDFVRNIVLFDEGVLLGGNWKNDHFFFDYNLYWNPEPSKIDFAGDRFEEWQARGHDRHSKIADPAFMDPKAGDFRLREGSPAFELGFEPIDLSDVGPRPKKD